MPFLGATIWLDSKPLIPRTETEWWVEHFVRECVARRGAPQAGSRGLGDFSAEKSAYPKRATSSVIKIVDLFAGSGCVGVAVLTHLPEARVDFGELEARHLATIKKNCEVNGVSERARVIQTDVWESVTGTYDFILANPPYLSTGRIERVQDSVLEHEPAESLFADDDGFALIEKALRGLPLHLKKGGSAWIEHEPEHTERIQSLARSLGYVATTHKDQYDTERYSIISTN